MDLIPTLVQTITKATGQASQSQLVSEAVTASCLLVKLSLVDIQAGNNRNHKMHSSILQVNKPSNAALGLVY